MNTNDSTKTSLILPGIVYAFNLFLIVMGLLSNIDLNRYKRYAFPFVVVGIYMMIQGRKIKKDQYA